MSETERVEGEQTVKGKQRGCVSHLQTGDRSRRSLVRDNAAAVQGCRHARASIGAADDVTDRGLERRESEIAR